MDFLRVADEYQNDIWEYSRISKPLASIARENIPFVWGPREQNSFDTIRDKLILHLKRHSKSRMKAGVDREDMGVAEAAKPGNRNLSLDDMLLEEDTQPLDVQVQKDLQKVGNNGNPESSQKKGTNSGAEQKSYRLSAPVHKPGLTGEVIENVMNAEVTMKLGDLLAVSGEVAKGVRTKLIKTRQPILDKENKAVWVLDEPFPSAEFVDSHALELDALHSTHLPDQSYFVSIGEAGVPAGAIVCPDPVECYLSNIPREDQKRVYESGMKIYTASESAALRCLFPTVNGRHQVEAVLDDGSQIVSMSLKRAVATMLTWNPDVKILMEAANGELKETEGLARNVPFIFGDLTVYLQVHVIEGAPYDILLGRPFAMLTESIVRNKMDGGSTVTIKDPNSSRRLEMPTYRRGARSIMSRPQDEILDKVSRPPTPEKKPEVPKTQVFQTLSRNWE